MLKPFSISKWKILLLYGKKTNKNALVSYVIDVKDFFINITGMFQKLLVLQKIWKVCNTKKTQTDLHFNNILVSHFKQVALSQKSSG